LAISPIMHAKKPRRSPLRLRFLTYLLEEISYAICITYFPTIPKTSQRSNNNANYRHFREKL
jgi:hypothetical protein